MHNVHATVHCNTCNHFDQIIKTCLGVIGMQSLPRRGALSSSRVALAVHPNLPNALLQIPSSSDLAAQRYYRKLAAISPSIHSTAGAAATRRYIGPSIAAAASARNCAQQETQQQGLEALTVHCNEQLLLLEHLVHALHAAGPQSGGCYKRSPVVT